MDVRESGNGPGQVGVGRGVRVGVDVGSVRVGVAASDPDGLVATPVETVRRGEGEPGPASTDVLQVAAIVRERSAAVVYVGLPRHLSGAEGSASQAARTYAGVLAHAVAPVPVRLVDERLSTVSAHQALHAAGRSGRRHRAVVDQAAAVVILQSAMDAERTTGARSGELVTSDPPSEGAPARSGT
ncbi:Holliday junction resolvase RuvX [Actinotalea sp. BY-33]|uniref:Putative pre-16S rRNA nuclease n=1 Tax=Actinotalea soli TaxID=2819234 RepID=A0A939RTT3_9CELL|nr:Holliday junction resolvase RuvX [Actinotalea soli]MBO1750460.1 Holliday junction resolvase RuvX [Actinotalea soli]